MTALAYQQRLFQSLRVSETAIVTREEEDLYVHSRQGDWDGACGLHCCVMALTLLGYLSRVNNLAERKNGLAGALWRAGKETYFSGMSAKEMAAILSGLNVPLEVKPHRGKNKQLMALTQTYLDSGSLPILGWDTRNGLYGHWVLAIGLEGTFEDGKFKTEAVLCLDPKEPAPAYCGYNGRLILRGPPPPSWGNQYVRYVSNSGHMRPVTITELVSVRNTQ